MSGRSRGHIEKRGKRSWRLKWEKPRDLETGKRQYGTKTIRGTKSAANRELTRILHSIGVGDYVDPTKITLGEHLIAWLDGTAKFNVSPRTFERYDEIVRQRWMPALGKRRLSELTALDIKRVETQWLTEGRADKTGGLSARTVRHFHWVLTNALDEAVRLRLLARNPARDVRPPKPQRKPIVWLAPKELAALIAASSETRVHIPVLLAATAGLRRGEVLALKWGNVDLSAGTITVAHSLENTQARGLQIKPPKSGKARTVALPALAVDALKEHATAQKKQRLKLGQKYKNFDLVCPDTRGGYWHPRNMSRVFSALVGEADIPKVTFHGLRHTHLTHLLQEGIHPKVASERAGHSSVAVTLDVYSHAIPDMQRDAADRIDDLIGGLTKKDDSSRA